jgi:hypothetical protein
MSKETELESALEQLHELNPSALRFSDPSFDEAIIGIASRQFSGDPVLVYDEGKMIELLVWREKWDYEEAYDFLCFNTFSAWMGDGTPIVVQSIYEL